ncbi:MAG TPA: hypothetical protein VGL11_08495 [Candidatus Binatia bacterium]|jgi:hypothetical protein
MEIKILDEFSPWMIYFLALVISCGFFVSAVVFVRSCRAGAHRRTSSKLPRFSGASLFFAIVAVFALWFLGVSMFDRFHAIAIAPDRIELVYMWPRPWRAIQRSDLVDVRGVGAYRTCGYMEIETREGIFKSVNFKKCEVAEEILGRLSGHVVVR